VKRLALIAGPLALVLVFAVPAPMGMADPAWRVAGIAAWLAIWWMSAVVPLEATSLLPIVLLPAAGIAPVGDVTPSYADPVIFLFLGGFFIGATLERWDLHKRFALRTVRAVGTDARMVLLAFMVASAFASMWISNTATTIMMLPIAVALVGGMGAEAASPASSRFPTALMLGIAYAASIGGVATLIGTPPNAIMAGAARELLGRDVTFAGWMAIGLPIVAPMLALAWLLLTRVFHVRGRIPELAAALRHEERQLGPMGRGERFVLGVFALTAAAWILRAPKTIGSVRVPGLTDLLPSLGDAQIAIAAALVLFAVPLPRARFRFALDWDTARGVPWGVLLLFGGGLALAGGFESSGLTEWLGARLGGLGGLPGPVIILCVAGLFVMLTELTSNTATTALGMPIMVGVARGLELEPFTLMATAAIAASMAFMLPVATPPNAIVYGSGRIRIADMVRAGIRLNVLAVVAISLFVWLFVG
jgi:sodium-dependent dicarboxylate transporter 2/3/5